MLIYCLDSTRFYVSAVELRSWELSAARPTHKFIAPGQICLPVMSVRSIRSFWFVLWDYSIIRYYLQGDDREMNDSSRSISCNFFLFSLITHPCTIFKIERKVSFFLGTWFVLNSNQEFKIKKSKYFFSTSYRNLKTISKVVSKIDIIHSFLVLFLNNDRLYKFWCLGSLTRKIFFFFAAKRKTYSRQLLFRETNVCLYKLRAE